MPVALSKLPEAYRSVVHLRDMQQLSLSEAVQLLHPSVPPAKADADAPGYACCAFFKSRSKNLDHAVRLAAHGSADNEAPVGPTADPKRMTKQGHGESIFRRSGK